MGIHNEAPDANIANSEEPEATVVIAEHKGLGNNDPEPHPGPPYETPPPEKKDRSGLKSILSTVALIIIAPLIALALTAFVFQSYEVDGQSMETSLYNSERLIVLKVPRTLAKITGHAYIPHRGDIIIFNNKLESIDFGAAQKRQLVKRVIGLPGDRVVIKGGLVAIYNSSHPNGFDPDKTLPYGVVIKSTSGNVDLTVQADHIFVLGDNRGNSLDSRVFGPISSNDVVGKLQARIYPFNKFKWF